MRKIYVYSLIVIAAGIAFNSCKDVYKPKAISTPNRYLVVDGYINGNDSTSFRLSRSRNIGDTGTIKYETSAQVYIQGQNGSNFTLTNKGNGLYVLGVTPFDFSSKYRLRISTGGKEYVSEYVPIKKSPPIDSVGFTANSDGVSIWVTSHDPAANTRYYKWDFVETWEYSSISPSPYVYINNGVTVRGNPSEFYRCWRTEASTTIGLGTSNGLASDIVNKAPIQYIEGSSLKLSTKYSTLVTQTVLTEDAFNYWSTLKKTSESLGSIFDPQPAQLRSNIVCTTTPSEPVIGYVSGTTSVKKRIFITKAELPPYLPTDYLSCSIDSFFFAPPGPPAGSLAERLESYFKYDVNMIVSEFYLGGPAPAGYLYSSRTCMDCREKGGVTKQPPFWQ